MRHRIDLSRRIIMHHRITGLTYAEGLAYATGLTYAVALQYNTGLTYAERFACTNGCIHCKRGGDFIDSAAINSHVYYSININGKPVPFITDAVIGGWVVVLAITVVLYLLTRKLSTLPSGKQGLAEMLLDFVSNLLKGQIGRNWKPFAPYLTTILLFLVFSNALAIFNIIPSGETLSAIFNNPALESFKFSMHPPTRNFNVTLCLAVATILVVIFAEFRYKGARGWFRSFYKPTPISGFIKLLDYVVRPMSLCLRLFGNILGGVIVMALIYGLLPVFLPAVVGIYFDLFDAVLQAYVFVFLTTIYISEAVEAESESESEYSSESASEVNLANMPAKQS